MTINEIKEKLLCEEYNFLKTDERLKNIIILGLGGSHAYGLATEHSDIDIRGVALNSKEEILLGRDFSSVVETNTDTTIYSFNKILELLTECNPNTIELLGLKPEQYLFISDIGKELLKNSHIFLSKFCIHTFLGYANSQLRRLENKSARLAGQAEREKHILKSIENAQYYFKGKYLSEGDSVHLYIDKSNREDMDSEIYFDANFSHYPLRDWCGMWNEMKTIISNYNKIGKRNSHAIEHNKLGKHMSQLLLLYMMGIDILEKEEIIPYREKEHDLLMDVRNGKYLDENRQPVPEFMDILNEYETKFDEAKAHTKLPDYPDYEAIGRLRASVNERIVRGIV